MKYSGKFIVIEGVDGAGKDTQVDFLKQELDSENSLFVREPGATLQGQKMREVILDYELDPATEVLLFYGSRNELLIHEIIPALEAGKTVVSNRFELSTYAYQIHGRQQEGLRPLVDSLHEKIVAMVDPVYIFFDCDIEEAKRRAVMRDEQNTRFDDEGAAFFNRVRDGYLSEITKFRHHIIDASRSIEEVKKDFLEITDSIIKNKNI